MEIGPVTIRAIQPVIAPRADVSLGQPAGRTELPPRAVVPSVGAVERPSTTASGAGVVERKVTIDPDTRSIVSRTFGAEGDLLSQVPDQALLRVKAYARQLVAEIDAKASQRRVERLT